VEDNQLGQKTICVGYYCGDQTACRNRMNWKREILGSKENYGEQFGLLQLFFLKNFE
jgi:hypothetical protein